MKFAEKIFQKRREELKKRVSGGIILFVGHFESKDNSPYTFYPFEQDDSFLYYYGVKAPNLIGVIDVDSGDEILFGEDPTIEDEIWAGKLPTIKELASNSGISNFKSLKELERLIHIKKGRSVHYLPSCRIENSLYLSNLLDIPLNDLSYSEELIMAVIAQRSEKSAEEIDEIDETLVATKKVFDFARSIIYDGATENEIAKRMIRMTEDIGYGLSFTPIVTINGSVLHNTGDRSHILKNGDILEIDYGLRSKEGYCSDITRAYPVSGKFTPIQKDIYSIVLEAQLEAIRSIMPGIKYLDIHLKVSKMIAEGLKSLGFMKGNIDDAVANGAHALFFPHGLGHMLGIIPHDMDTLGEDRIGYDNNTKRSSQFGLAYLRLAKELKENFLFTVEPGIYFIKPLMQKWKRENLHTEFIDYEKSLAFNDVSGIRIEDNVVVTKKGCRVLGSGIAKHVDSSGRIID